MDKSIIFEKVKKIVAENLEIEPSEVTLNTEISEKVYTPSPSPSPSPSSSPNNFWLSWLPNISIASSSSSISFGLDLTKIEIIMALEEEFDIEIPDEDGENIKIVQQVIDYIYNKLVV
jgi:acyl carrier protein